MQMKSIGEVIQEKSIVIKGGYALSTCGFTQAPKAILKFKEITPVGKMTYAMLLSHAWQNDYCYPGQERLACDIGVSNRSVRTFLKELEAKGLLKVKQQGQGRTNIYQIDLKAYPKTALQGIPTKKRPFAICAAKNGVLMKISELSC